MKWSHFTVYHFPSFTDNLKFYYEIGNHLEFETLLETQLIILWKHKDNDNDNNDCNTDNDNGDGYGSNNNKNGSINTRKVRFK